MLKRVELSPEAIRYVRDSLENGNSFARLLLSLPLEEGSVFSFLPECPQDAASLGWEFVAPAEQSDLQLSEYIVHFLKSSPRNYAVFEDALINMDDLCVACMDVPFFSHGKEVYYFASAEADENFIVSLKRWAQDYIFNGVLASLPSEECLGIGQVLTREKLEVICQNTHSIIVGAYEGEGVIVWSRAPREHEAVLV